ncbi:hypothetical protein AAD018_003330 [Aestuariibius insulae]|uniref:hypothetical protein n=1 Tax=Aestuariibius insulae TaxID=2058287 RepID=UPI00345E06B7
MQALKSLSLIALCGTLAGCGATRDLIIPPTDQEIAQERCKDLGLTETSFGFEPCVQGALEDIERERRIAAG